MSAGYWIGAGIAAAVVAFPRLIARSADGSPLFGERADRDTQNAVRVAAIAVLGIFLALIYFDIKL